MPVDAEPVHLCVVVIGIQQVQRHPVVSRLERAEHIGRKHGAIRRKFAENRLADVRRHAAKASVCVLFAQVLVFVIIIIGNLDLTDRFGRQIAPRL